MAAMPSARRAKGSQEGLKSIEQHQKGDNSRQGMPRKKAPSSTPMNRLRSPSPPRRQRLPATPQPGS